MTRLICDAHCHFFSTGFFSRLAAERDGDASPEAAAAIVRMLGWDDPESSHALATRWLEELDRFEVQRATLIASVPGDQNSVAQAVALFPQRFVGFFMIDPTVEAADEIVDQALTEGGLSGVCLFPAMHRYSLTEPAVERIFRAAAGQPSKAVFVHCGVLSLGVRRRLGLSSPFESFRANPLQLEALASRYPQVPVIVPHFGAGMFREALMLADLCPNVLLDTSSSNGWIRYHPALSLARVFSQAIEVAGADRLLFGTDSSFFPRGWHKTVFDAQLQVLEEIGVSDSEREQILGGNFERLFPMP